MGDHQHGHSHSHGHVGADDRPVWDATFWDERYSSSPNLWSGHVNAVVRDEAGDLEPGKALDVGCGEGGDALWLGERGWTVLGVDVSQVAVERATARADELGLGDGVRFEVRDLMTWRPPAAAFDLVSVAFVHLPTDDRRSVYADLAAAVSIGGTFLVAAHHPSDLGVVPRPPYPDLFFTPEDLVGDLHAGAVEWEVVIAEARPRPTTHEGADVTIADTVVRARRLA